MFALLKTNKSIFKTFFILVLVNKKVFLKNRILHDLSYIHNHVITIPYIFRAEPLISCIRIPVNCQNLKKMNLIWINR